MSSKNNNIIDNKKTMIIGVVGAALLACLSIIAINKGNLNILDNLNKKEDKTFKLEFADPNCTSYVEVPYEDGYVVSYCKDIYYTDDEYTKIPLGEAIRSSIITVEEITSKMTLIDKSDDDSSKVYIYNSKDIDLSDSYFRLEVCDSIDHIIFMNDKINYYECTPRKEKEFTITLENGKCNSKEKVIYELNDDYKIYSRCGEIYYSDEETANITLGEAIDNYYVTAWDIADKMEEEGSFYSGTYIYKYNKKNKTLSDSSFKLELIDGTRGIKGYLFLSYNSNNYKL